MMSLRRRDPRPSAALAETTVNTTTATAGVSATQVDILAAVSASQDPTDDAIATQVILGLLDNAQRLGLVWELALGRVVHTDPNTRVPYVRLDYDDVELRTPSLIGDVPDGLRVMVLRTPPSSRYIIGTPLLYPRLVDAVNVTSGNTTAPASSTVSVPTMTLSGYVIEDAAYHITGQCVYYVSNTGVEGNLLLYDQFSTLIGRVRLGRLPFTGAGTLVSWAIPWTATVTGLETITYSLQSVNASGTVTVQAGNHNWGMMHLVGMSGTIRTA